METVDYDALRGARSHLPRPPVRTVLKDGMLDRPLNKVVVSEGWADLNPMDLPEHDEETSTVVVTHLIAHRGVVQPIEFNHPDLDELTLPTVAVTFLIAHDQVSDLVKVIPPLG